jgi:hypothetical protein
VAQNGQVVIRAWLQPGQFELAEPFADRALGYCHRETPGHLGAQINAAPPHDLRFLGSGPTTTSARNSAICASVGFAVEPDASRDRRPAMPVSLQRCTQSRKVCRSIPAWRAASRRDEPSRTMAIGSSRRLCAVSRHFAANARRSAAAWSVRVIVLPCPSGPPNRRTVAPLSGLVMLAYLLGPVVRSHWSIENDQA